MFTDDRFEESGFVILSGVINAATLADLLGELQPKERQAATPQRERVYARRNLFQTMPAVRMLAHSRSVRAVVEPYLGVDCFAVRTIFFDKTAWNGMRSFRDYSLG